MKFVGKVQNGVVVFDGPCPLPEGNLVTVESPAPQAAIEAEPAQRVQLPLVPSDRPGSIELANNKIAEILEWDDIFKTKLEIRPGNPDDEPEITDISRDDLL